MYIGSSQEEPKKKVDFKCAYHNKECHRQKMGYKEIEEPLACKDKVFLCNGFFVVIAAITIAGTRHLCKISVERLCLTLQSDKLVE